MKKFSAVLLVVLTSSTVFAIMPKGKPAALTMEQKVKLVEKMVMQQVGEFATDLRVTRGVVSKEGICGGSGPAIIVDIEVRNLVRTLNEETGAVELKEEWNVIKTYGATASEVGGMKTILMDSEGCME